MKERTKAYMAGIMDGEGCFAVFKAIKPNYVNYRPFVGFTNSSKKLVKWAVKHFGGVVHIQKENVNSTSGYTSKQLYHWRLYGRKSVRFLLVSLTPYLFEKKQQASLLLEYINLEGKNDPQAREGIFQKLKAMKKIGCVTTETPDIEEKTINAYLAAIIDGEGHLTISKGVYKETRIAYNPRIGITSSYLPLMELVKTVYGGNYCDSKNKIGKPVFIWYISSKTDIERILLKILPYLLCKREKAKILLNFVRLGNRHDKETRATLRQKIVDCPIS